LNDLDVSADYMERLVDETLRSLPQVFIDPEVQAVREELEALKDQSSHFRSMCKVSLDSAVLRDRAEGGWISLEWAGTTVQPTYETETERYP
jgi:hypothetical protein